MKNIKSLAIVGLALVVLGFNSCSPEFLDRKPTTAIANEVALTSVSNVESATVGLMLYFATAGYTGRNLPVIGDLITDNVTTSAGNSGHLLDIEMWNISSSLSEVGTFWNGSYQIISASAKVVQACNTLRDAASDNEKKTLDKCKATALTVKAFAEYILTQYYCLPYSAANSSLPYTIPGPDQMNGIILVPKDSPVSSDNAINSGSTLRSASLKETYDHMHEELSEAIALFDASQKDFISSNAAFFPSKCMALTLQARLYLEQSYGDAERSAIMRDSAVSLAQAALHDLPSGASAELVNNGQTFLEQYRSIAAPTKEDILTVNFTTSDNLSANSINNMFGSYGCRVSSEVTSLFSVSGNNDIRRPIYLSSAQNEKLEIYSSCGKYPNENNINNVPVIRVPELYLIIAEARSVNGVDDPDYKDAMLKTLGKRDTSIHEDYDKLKTTYFTEGVGAEAALKYVLDEKRREFAAEGHRWFDLRRTKSTLTHNEKASDFRIKFSEYPIYAFAFPIPESETNTGAWQNGQLHQNEAWVENGDSWSIRYQLPRDGGSDYSHE